MGGSKFLLPLLLSALLCVPALASSEDDDDDEAPPAAAKPTPQAPAPTSPAPVATPAPAAAPPAPRAAPPPLQAPVPVVLPPAPGPVAPVYNAKAAQLNASADQLATSFAQHSQTVSALHDQRNSQATDFYRFTGDLNRKLAIGTPANDPAMVDELDKARQSLAFLRGNTGQLNDASAGLTNDAETALHLSQDVRTELDVPGLAPGERAAFAQIEAKVSTAQANIDQALRSILAETARQNRSLSIEGQNLDVLAREVGAGALESSTPRGTADDGAARNAVESGDATIKPRKNSRVAASVLDAPLSSTKPLAVITRDSAGQAYEHQLYEAISATLARSPHASFTIQATTPHQTSTARGALEANEAQHKADDVVRSLATFGLPRSRMTVTQSTNPSLAEPEVQVFARQ